MRRWAFNWRLASQIQFDRHEEPIWLGTRISFGYRERDRNPGRDPALRHLEGLDPKPVHAVLPHVPNVLEVLPQERQFRLDTRIHSA